MQDPWDGNVELGKVPKASDTHQRETLMPDDLPKDPTGDPVDPVARPDGFLADPANRSGLWTVGAAVVGVVGAVVAASIGQKAAQASSASSKARLNVGLTLSGEVHDAFKSRSLPSGHDWVWKIQYRRNIQNARSSYSSHRLWYGGGNVILDLDPGEWYLWGHLGFLHRPGFFSGERRLTWIADTGTANPTGFQAGQTYDVSPKITTMDTDDDAALFRAITKSGSCNRCRG
ncbi:hypothetical protein ACFVHB_37495 [Kitasatospora sp. NPDC127111]|uniref:hypothetical protein n=1 Tax=Kitasatospora sp. NPDC127111 TaxID=3345363 RepID=UPI00362CE984